MTCIRIIILLLTFVASIRSAAIGQIKSYDSSGHVIDAADERIIIHIDTNLIHRSAALPISLPGVLGAVITLGIDVAKNIATNREQQFMATYTATNSQKGLIILDRENGNSSYQLNIGKIQIKRILVLPDNTEIPATTFSLEPDVDKTNGYFRFQLTSLDFYSAKARIKKHGKSGKMVDFSVTVKIDASWIDQPSQNENDSSASSHTLTKPASKADGTVYKTATLGQSTFLIPAVKPAGPILLPIEPCYTGWFQMLPMSALELKTGDGSYKIGDYVITVTVKEANPYELSAKKLSGFLSTNGTDLQTIIKLISSPSSK